MSETSNTLPTHPKTLPPWLDLKNRVSSPAPKHKRIPIDPEPDTVSAWRDCIAAQGMDCRKSSQEQSQSRR